MMQTALNMIFMAAIVIAIGWLFIKWLMETP